MPIDKLTLGAAMALCGSGGDGSTVDYEARNIASKASSDVQNAFYEINNVKNSITTLNGELELTQNNVSKTSTDVKNISNVATTNQQDIEMLSDKIQKHEVSALIAKQTIIGNIYELNRYNKKILKNNIAIALDSFSVNNDSLNEALTVTIDGYNGVTLNGTIKPNQFVKVSMPIFGKSYARYQLIVDKITSFNYQYKLKLCFGKIMDSEVVYTHSYLFLNGSGCSQTSGQWSASDGEACLFIRSEASEDIIFDNEFFRFFLLDKDYVESSEMLKERSDYDIKISGAQKSIFNEVMKMDVFWSPKGEEVGSGTYSELITTHCFNVSDVYFIEAKNSNYEFIICCDYGGSPVGSKGLYDKENKRWLPINTTTPIKYYRSLYMSEIDDLDTFSTFRIIGRRTDGNIDLTTGDAINVYKTVGKTIKDIIENNSYLKRSVERCEKNVEGYKYIGNSMSVNGEINSTYSQYDGFKVFKLAEAGKKYSIYTTGRSDAIRGYGLYRSFMIDQLPFEGTFSSSRSAPIFFENTVDYAYLIVYYASSQYQAGISEQDIIVVEEENKPAVPLGFLTTHIYYNDVAGFDIPKNSLVIWRGKLYKSKININSGGSLSTGNLTSVTLSDCIQGS